MRGRSPLRFLLALCVASVSAAGCGPPCRDIQTRPLDFACEATRGFSGELHFDSEATFETFLAQQCLSRSSDELAREIAASVDFTREAVFVAVGPLSLDQERCLESRELASCQVCEGGLKVLFQDATRDIGAVCPSTVWTVAFALKREDLRAALDAAGGF